MQNFCLIPTSEYSLMRGLMRVINWGWLLDLTEMPIKLFDTGKSTIWSVFGSRTCRLYCVIHHFATQFFAMTLHQNNSPSIFCYFWRQLLDLFRVKIILHNTSWDDPVFFLALKISQQFIEPTLRGEKWKSRVALLPSSVKLMSWVPTENNAVRLYWSYFLLYIFITTVIRYSIRDRVCVVNENDKILNKLL